MANSITEEGLRTLKYYHFVRQWGKRVMLPIFEYNFLHGTGKTIFEVLQDVGVDLHNINYNFNNKDREKIKSNVPPDTLDITLMYKISKVLWDHRFNVPSKALKKSMEKIKDERNSVSHEEKAITHTELEVKLVDFGKVLETALDKAQAHYSHLGANFDPMKTEIQSDIPKIKEKIREKFDLSVSQDQTKFQQEIQENIDYLHEFLHERIKEKLVDVCSRKCNILPFDCMPQHGAAAPSDIFVPLQMRIDEKFHRKLKAKDLITLDQKDIFNLKDPSNKDPEVIILSGNAGSGKTTFLSSIVEKWHKGASDIPLLSTYDTLLYMQFRSHDHDNFDDYLKGLLPVTVSQYGIDNITAAILKFNCLFVCDGWDEVNNKSKKLYESLLKLECKQMKMIVTSRPSSVKDLTHVIQQSNRTRINLNMLEVADQNVELHIKKITSYLESDGAERQKMEDEIIEAFDLMEDNLRQVLKTPLWLNLFILLYIDCPEKRGNYNSVTSLYQQLTENRRDRIVSKVRDLDMKKALEFEKLYNKWAFQYYQKHIYELSQEDAEVFEEECKDRGLCSDSIMSSFFNIKYTKKGLKVMPVYCFVHRTEQEYASAAYISNIIIEFCKKKSVDDVKKGGENVIYIALKSAGLLQEKQKWSYELVDILPFITGILNNTNLSVFKDVIDDITDLHWMLSGKHFPRGDEIVIDFLTVHCVETNNDQWVIEAIKRKLGNAKTLITGRSETLTCFHSVIQGVKPRKVVIGILLPESGSALRRLQHSIERQMKQGASGSHFEIPDSVQKFKLNLHCFLSVKEANVQELTSISKLLVPKEMSYRTAELYIAGHEDSTIMDLELSKENSPVIGMESPTVHFRLTLNVTFRDENDSLAYMNKLANALLPVDKECYLEVYISVNVEDPKTKIDQQVCNSGQIAVGHSSPADQQGCSAGPTAMSTSTPADQQQLCNAGPNSASHTASTSNSPNQQGFNIGQTAVSVAKQSCKARPPSAVTAATQADQRNGCNSHQKSTVSPLELVNFTQKIKFRFIPEFDEWNDSTIQRMAMVINGAWPRQMQYHEGIVEISNFFMAPNITKKVIKQLGELLTIKPGVSICIENASEKAFEAREELSAFYEEKGYKRLCISKDDDDIYKLKRRKKNLP